MSHTRSFYREQIATLVVILAVVGGCRSTILSGTSDNAPDPPRKRFSGNQTASPAKTVPSITLVSDNGLDQPKADSSELAKDKLADAFGFNPYTDWLQPGDRQGVPAIAETIFTDQDGETGALSDLIERPTAVIFFYTRCTNANKCSAAVTSIAGLQKLLEQSGLDGDVRLLMISYEPEFDTPDRLRGYGVRRGIEVGKNARLLQVKPSHLEPLLKALDVPVSYNASWVNLHGLALYVLDERGRLARKYHTMIWDNDLVIADLKTLVADANTGNANVRSQ